MDDDEDEEEHGAIQRGDKDMFFNQAFGDADDDEESNEEDEEDNEAHEILHGNSNNSNGIS